MSAHKLNTKKIYVLFVKRLFDFATSLILLVLLSPMILLLLLTVFLQFFANPFFVQERIGKGGRLFKIYKIRTFKTTEDYASVDRFGKLLRKLSLDELPQLGNILMGHMSFVGPRPLLVEYRDYYSDEQWRRHEVKPGLTGYAQVVVGNSPDWDLRMKYDQDYLGRISFWFDLMILLKTIGTLFKHNGRTDASVEIERFDQFVQRK